jgi:hypothetical protein
MPTEVGGALFWAGGPQTNNIVWWIPEDGARRVDIDHVQLSDVVRLGL